jgi:hypothetical protein
MIEIEDTSGVVFPGEVLNMATFGRAGSLWRVVTELAAARDGRPAQ